MATSFLPYEPNQTFLLPPSPSQWLAEDHLVYFVSEIIDRLELGKFYARYEGDARRNQPYDPALLVKVLVYGYATRVFSSRQLARKLYEDVGFRVLGAGNFPSHRTICEFRMRHLPELKELFVAVARLAKEMGLVKLGTVALDRTKVKALSSKHKAMSYGQMKEQEQKLKAQIQALLERARQTDVQEDAQWGTDQSEEPLAQELKDGKIVWPRLKRPSNAWKSAKLKPIGSGGAIPMMSSAEGMEPGGRSSGRWGYPRTKRRITSPIPSRAS